MKINSLQVGDDDLNGRTLNDYDLQQELCQFGICSNYIVNTKKSSTPDVHTLIPNSFQQEYQDLMSSLSNRLDAGSAFYQASYELLFNKFFLNADIVHYHLSDKSFFNFIHLPILTKLKPTVWALHDTILLSSDNATSVNLKFQEIAFQNSDMDIIVNSKWIYDKVLSLTTFKNKKIHLIPFGLNLEVFKPQNKKRLRVKFGIPYDNFVICLCVSKLELKGIKYTKELLKLLKNIKNITIITYNESGLLIEFEDYFQIIELGLINDKLQIANMYAAADIFVSTSLSENFGLSAVESVACGTPVLAFDNTAITEIIEAPFAGIVVPETDIYAMKDKLMDLMSNQDKLNQLAINARSLAQRKYNKADYIEKIVNVYKEVIDRRGFDPRGDFIINQQQNILGKRQEIFGHTNQRNDHIIGQNQAMIDLGVVNSRVYKTLIKLKQKKSVRIFYFNIARPAFRVIKKVRNYVKK